MDDAFGSVVFDQAVSLWGLVNSGNPADKPSSLVWTLVMKAGVFHVNGRIYTGESIARYRIGPAILLM